MKSCPVCANGDIRTAPPEIKQNPDNGKYYVFVVIGCFECGAHSYDFKECASDDICDVSGELLNDMFDVAFERLLN